MKKFSAMTGVPEGILAVFLFSLTTPTMKIAVADFQPVVVGVGRMVIAAVPAAIVLLLTGSPRLNFRQICSLLVTTACLGIGFSWLTAEALHHVPSFHAAVMIGAVPFITALMASLRSGQRQSWLFWAASGIGGLLVVGYGLMKSGGHLTTADLLLLAAAILCGTGYAEGARLGREIGSLKVACWVPIAASPVAVLVCWGRLPENLAAVSVSSWAALLYTGWFSVLVGFIFWYRALSIGGTARIGQIQLMQPFFSLGLAALLLREPLTVWDWAMAAGVVACVGMAQAANLRSREPLLGNVDVEAVG